MKKQRREYEDSGLQQLDSLKEPFSLFNEWYQQAVKSNILEPNAATLATVSLAPVSLAAGQGMPNARTVLLKGCDARGFVFFTNYNSIKARELADNPQAALLIFWAELSRQVRIQGVVSKVSAAESDEYFRTRPRDAQIGAWASDQSAPLESRALLEKLFKEAEEKFKNQDVPRPSYWGGYCLSPQLVEFWQGRAHRLHDRLVFTRLANGEWKKQRLFS